MGKLAVLIYSPEALERNAYSFSITCKMICDSGPIFLNGKMILVDSVTPGYKDIVYRKPP